MQEQVIFATAGALDLASAPVELETAGDFHLDSITRQHDGHNHRGLLKRAVAALPPSAIADMQRRELIFAIRTAELPWLDSGLDRLEHADRHTLERLTFLARRVCRRQLALAHASDHNADPAHKQNGRRLCDPPALAENTVDRDRTALDPLHWMEKAR